MKVPDALLGGALAAVLAAGTGAVMRLGPSWREPGAISLRPTFSETI
jgi:hypothetical protein